MKRVRLLVGGPKFATSVMLVGVATSFLLTAFPMGAAAHVKWFAPYIAAAQPAPVGKTLADRWFWLGICLTLVFFVVTRIVEKSRFGAGALDVLDGLTTPLWTRVDDYLRAIIAAFFVAVFAVGGIYLTPDLKTPAEWVSWLQLVLAALIFSRRTMPFAGFGIVGLWLLALRDYDLFHLLDYLSLGLGVAAYLFLEPLSRETWRSRRIEALRWGLAVALMWSSLEKFAYPTWFYPLVVERPFLTFGLPRDVFIPMAGVAEFTLGFGLVWTPLIRRLSAIALLVIFTAAVWPFGRTDLIGHGLIMAVLLAVAADPSRQTQFLPAFKSPISSIPVGLLLAFTLYGSLYWGLHTTIYGRDQSLGDRPIEKTTHSYSTEYPHGPDKVSPDVSD
ncbi:hypothetical protein HDIA_2063 [Hartmannibacter diazotrophicus]|uniref:Uncharacterized protein n=1 Tax=Hartmannibacter diazotrophicus TaxID=1482074 RepID=A0A2C9D5K5_9HYPH|nr:hypothetical protein [Hartmannibacter diazotrophicus]SON55604.1 hypothetical protein HDIA_2063 [Hartmannibacter diazotrophicus]